MIAQNQQIQQQLQSLASQMETEGRERQQMDQNVEKIESRRKSPADSSRRRNGTTRLGVRSPLSSKRHSALPAMSKRCRRSRKLYANCASTRLSSSGHLILHNLSTWPALRAWKSGPSGVETLEKRLGEGEKKRTIQQQRINDLAAQLNTLMATVGKVEKTVANSHQRAPAQRRGRSSSDQPARAVADPGRRRAAPAVNRRQSAVASSSSSPGRSRQSIAAGKRSGSPAGPADRRGHPAAARADRRRAGTRGGA